MISVLSLLSLLCSSRLLVAELATRQDSDFSTEQFGGDEEVVREWTLENPHAALKNAWNQLKQSAEMREHLESNKMPALAHLSVASLEKQMTEQVLPVLQKQKSISGTIVLNAQGTATSLMAFNKLLPLPNVRNFDKVLQQAGTLVPGLKVSVAKRSGGLQQITGALESSKFAKADFLSRADELEVDIDLEQTPAEPSREKKSFGVEAQQMIFWGSITGMFSVLAIIGIATKSIVFSTIGVTMVLCFGFFTLFSVISYFSVKKSSTSEIMYGTWNEDDVATAKKQFEDIRGYSILAAAASERSYSFDKWKTQDINEVQPLCNGTITTERKVNVECTDTQSMLFVIKDMCVIAFRGTVSFMDFRVDLNMAKARVNCKDLEDYPSFPDNGETLCQLHAGILHSYKSQRAGMKGYLERNCEGKKVLITGHSLGGGLASLAAYDLAPKYDVMAISFGAPNVGDSPFRDEYLKRVKHTIRYVEHTKGMFGMWWDDIITSVTHFGYLHLTAPIYLECSKKSGPHKCHHLKYYTESLINHDKEANGAQLCNHPENAGFKLEPWEKCPAKCTPGKPEVGCEKCSKPKPKCTGSSCTQQGTEDESIIPNTPGYPDSDAIDTIGLQQNSKSQQPTAKQPASHDHKPTADAATKVATNLQQNHQPSSAAAPPPPPPTDKVSWDKTVDGNAAADAEGQDGQQAGKGGHWWNRLKSWFHGKSGEGEAQVDENSATAANDPPVEEIDSQQEGQQQKKGGHWWDRLKASFSTSADDSQTTEDNTAEGQEMERKSKLTKLPEDAM